MPNILIWENGKKVIREMVEGDFVPNQPPPEAIVAERNRLLAESDFRMVPDAPWDTTAWATYRQALRDLTTQEGFPTNVVWPTPPE